MESWGGAALSLQNLEVITPKTIKWQNVTYRTQNRGKHGPSSGNITLTLFFLCLFFVGVVGGGAGVW